MAALAALLVAAVACARFVSERDPRLASALDALGLLTLAYLSAAALDGFALTVAWSAEAVVLNEIADREGIRLPRVGALGFLWLAGVHVLVIDAPPGDLYYGSDALLEATVGLLAFALALLRCARTGAADRSLVDTRGALDEHLALEVLGAAALVYLASVAIVTPFQPTPAPSGATVGVLDVRQQGQVLLSGFWSLAGLGALTLGLVRNVRRLRSAGLALLGLALAKVFVFDLQNLDSIYRVLSFVAIGVLLLAGAFAYQRIRTEREKTGDVAA